MLDVTATAIPDVRVLVPRRFGDERGFFSETFNRRRFEEHGIRLDWVQDNHAYSQPAGTVRGLHYQLPPFAQDKLVRVTRGAVLDVAVDIRRGSPTFGRYVAVELRADAWNQVLVPRGFAHGYCTLEPDTEVIYKVTDYYAPEHERGLLWNDPELGITWPVGADQAVLSDKDLELPVLARQPDLFDLDDDT
jgi:dTDP-4-dehydrorhamnose 3,5-epimerase